jgi:predicted Zn-dependent protease
VTYQLIGYTAAQLYSGFGATLERTIRSFAPLTDADVINVQPQRIDVVKVPTAMTISEFARRFNSAVPPETLAILNGLPGPESQLSAGTLAKRVVGDPAGGT